MKSHVLSLSAMLAAVLATGTAGAQSSPDGLSPERDTLSGNEDRCGASPNRSSYEASSGSYGKRRLEIIGLTDDQRLICFDERNPGGADRIGQVSGLGGIAGDARLVGIDFRPATGDLYGVGDAGGVYTIDPDTGVATFRAQLSVPLLGVSFGVDVNPAADALRIVSDTGQNLRFSFAAGTTTMDGTLTYPPLVTAAAGLTGAAYTNNDSDLNTATTLYDADSTLDQVAIQAPANAGTLSPTGKLGVDSSAQVGFDIYSTIRNGSTVDVQGFASLSVNGQARFYKITLFTGKASFRGRFRSRDQVIGIAIPLNQL